MNDTLRISELIQKLEEIKEKSGDVCVFVRNAGLKGNPSYGICDVSFYNGHLLSFVEINGDKKKHHDDDYAK